MKAIRIDKLNIPELSASSEANLVIVIQDHVRDATRALDQELMRLQGRIHELEQLVWNDRRTRTKRKSLLARWWPRRA